MFDFLAYLSHLLAFLRCHTGAYLLSLWVVCSPSPSAALRHRVRIPYHFGGSPASCSDPLSFQWLSNIVFGSPIDSVALWHRVRIPFLFDSSPASYSGPLSFLWLFSIVSGSIFFSVALWNCVWISYLFSGSLASCPNPLSFRWLSSIVFWSLSFWRLSSIVLGSPFFSTTLWHRTRIFFLFCALNIVSGSPIFSTALRHRARILYLSNDSPDRVWIPFLFGDSPASCLDHLSFRRLSDIVPESLFFSAALRHCV